MPLSIPGRPANQVGGPADASAVRVRGIRKQVFADMLWALMSGAEFQFNH